MWISTSQAAELREVYLHRSKEPAIAGGEEPRLGVWVVIGGLTLNMDLAEVPRLIAALDEAMEKSEEIPEDARGTVWRTEIKRGAAPASETP